MPPFREVQSIAHVERVTPIRARFLARVAPSLGVIEVEIHYPGLPFKTFSERIVLQCGVNLALELPRSDPRFGVNDDKSARQIAVFGRRNAPYHLHILDIVGTDLA